MDPTLEAAFILLLVGLSALFSGMETALVSLSDVRLRSMAESDERMPRLLRLWVDEPNDVLAMLLIGNNVVNITASALATDFTERMLRGGEWSGWGIPIAVGAMTLLILIFGEVAPKTYAKHHPEHYAKALPLLNPFYAATLPFMRVLVYLTRRIVRWMGGDVASERATVTEEDIEEMVRVGRIEGSLDPAATRLLTGVLELDEKVAREIMVPRTDIVGIPVDTPIEDVVAAVTASGYSRYPVYRESVDDVIGVLYVKDLLSAVLTQGRGNVSLEEILRDPMIVPENIALPDLLLAMKRERVHLAVIASEYGGVDGVVSLEDIVEEVFGDIYDEHDLGRAPIRRLGDGKWVVDGVVTISDLEDQLGLELSLGDEGQEYETVAGLLMRAAGRMPEAGFTHRAGGLVFEVKRSDATRLAEVAVHRLTPEDDVAAEEGEGDVEVRQGPGDAAGGASSSG
ncbi:MAG: hemolysin family protein [Myxococcota bacterium]